MIILESVTRTYRAFTAVDDVSFTAWPGRVTGFLGPNGAGKSTTMRILVGLTRATSGTATISGRGGELRHCGGMTTSWPPELARPDQTTTPTRAGSFSAGSVPMVPVRPPGSVRSSQPGSRRPPEALAGR